MLFGAPECVAVSIASDGTLYGVRCVIRRTRTVLAAAESVPSGNG